MLDHSERRRAGSRSRDSERERRLGHVLDEMSDADVDVLIARMGSHAGFVRQLLGRYGRTAGIVRKYLLQQLDAPSEPRLIGQPFWRD